jgi:ComF family protein
LIHALKYKDLIRIVSLFQQYLVRFVTHNLANEQVDIVTPVPIHRVRQRSRGYNQAELISNAVADILQKPHLPHLLRRRRYTKTQTKLNREERKLNVTNAFSIKKGIGIQGKNILLVDDVFTTGSTVNSISSILKEEGCKKVFVLTISHA